MTMLNELRREMESAVEIVNRIEVVRSQLDGLGRTVEDAAIKTAAAELHEKLISLERTLLEVRTTGPGSVSGGGAKLLGKIVYLVSEVGSGDFKPTDQQHEVQKLIGERLATIRKQLEALLSRDLTAINDLLRKRNVPHIIGVASEGVLQGLGIQRPHRVD